MTRKQAITLFVLLGSLLQEPVPVRAGYLARPFAMLGVDGGTHAFQVTPEGWLRSGTATLAFSLDGAPLEPWVWIASGPGAARAMARSASGELAVEAAAVRRPGVLADVQFRGSAGNRDTLFARVEQPVLVLRLRLAPAAPPAAGAPPARLVVRLAADSGQEQSVVLNDGLVRRRLVPARPAAPWAGGSRTGIAVADSLVLIASAAPDSIGAGVLVAGEPVPEVCALVYRPAGAFELELWMPYFPLPVPLPAGSGDDPQISALAADGGADLITGAGRDWEERLTMGARLALPESLVVETAIASLYHLLGGSVVAAGDRAVILGAPFLYREFYMRDSAYLVVALDQFGYHTEARLALEAMLAHQNDKGELMSHQDQHDGNGLALWALGEHIAVTRDPAFARQTLEAVGRAVSWYRRALAPYQGPVPGERGEWDQDFPGILPATIMKDAEQVVGGHIVGHNLWASAGLAGAIEVARMAGAADSMRAWQKLSGAFDKGLDRYLTALEERAGLVAATFEGVGTQAGYAQPTSGLGGLDWGNLEIVYPTRVWRGDDPRLRTSLEAWSGRLDEGLYPYPFGFNQNLIHHYLTTSLGHALLAAGSDSGRARAFDILYDGLLGHTTATGGGVELINKYTHDVWPFDNVAPHNTFSSRYLLLLRDMLVSEVGDTLLAGAGLSPAWIVPGGEIELAATATRFGWVDLRCRTATTDASAATIELAVTVAPEPPARMLAPRLHLPPPRLPVAIGEPAAPPSALVFRAPLGYRIAAVHDAAGAATGVIQNAGQRVVLRPAVVSGGIQVELQGAADPRFSAATARARQEQRSRQP